MKRGSPPNPPCLFSPELQKKLDALKAIRPTLSLGRVHFSSPLLLAPMSAICSAPFRLLMEELGAGGTVSELVSCHGINYGNLKTRQMLKIHPREKHVGIQLFGEDAQAMAQAAEIAQESEPQFIDINMGCPVRKVVKKGGGSALLRDTSQLGHFFSKIKKTLQIPLTIKIRTGWNENSINAHEVISIAYNEGIEFVAIHGRTRAQAYQGRANWSLLESLANQSPLPLIGNGDLHTAQETRERLLSSRCQALMLGRGPLRNPFIFLESFLDHHQDSPFTPQDYWEVIWAYFQLLENYVERKRTLLVQLRKIIVWMATGFPHAAPFREKIFQTDSLKEILKQAQDYFTELSLSGYKHKNINHERPFMAGGHG